MASGSSAVEMDPQVAQRLLVEGATLVLLDMPLGTEFGIDMNSWNTGERFKGVKMIPPGIHFVYYSSVNLKNREVAPRTGFFINFSRGELVARRWDPSVEDVVDTVSVEDIDRMKEDIRNLDKYLGVYPYNSWKKWVSLTNRISPATLVRLEPIARKICSAPELVSDPRSEEERGDKEEEDPRLPKMCPKPGTEIRYTPLWRYKFPTGSTPGEISKFSMDSSHQLSQFISSLDLLYGDQVSSSMSDHSHTEEVLAEMQFSFLCFLVGRNYDSFERWKRLVVMFCNCDEALVERSQLFLNFINDLYFQMREVPNDFFVDIVTSNNFLVTSLSAFFSSIRTSVGATRQLKDKAAKFEANLTKKFDWDFSVERDDSPVVVEIQQVN